MATHMQDGRGIGGWVRPAAWSVATGLILLPLIAMQFTTEVSWGPEDFIFATVLIGGVGLAFELVVRRSRSRAYRAAAALALVAGFMLVWVNAAVGIIGSEDNPANLMYFGVLAVALAGAAIARFRAPGTARAMLGAALAVCLAGLIAIAGGLGLPENGPVQLLLLTGFFAAPWLGSAWLFRRAAEEERAA